MVVAGGGHNGLVAAILAAEAGWPVTLLERSDHLGGASAGSAVFPRARVRLSRYSYLVSLFPDELARRLGIDLRLASRRVSSFTPIDGPAGPDGLLVERHARTGDRGVLPADHRFGRGLPAWQHCTANWPTWLLRWLRA